MRRFKCPVMLLAGLSLALSGLLVACGVTETGDTPAGANPSSAATVVVHGTPGTVQVVPSRAVTPSPSSGTPDTSGTVTLLLDKTAYAPGSAANVTISNGLATKIVVTDHHTTCTYVQLEQQVAGQWQPVGTCTLMTPTRLVELAAGSVTPQRISIPAGPGGAGTYRVSLRYNNNTAYSGTFTVA